MTTNIVAENVYSPCLRSKLRDIEKELRGFADRDPSEISFGAASSLGAAANEIVNALQFAVSRAEIEEMRRA